MHRSLVVLFGMGLSTLPLAGCSSRGDGGSGADGASVNVARETPPIHVEQTEVMLKNGQPAIEQLYREALAQCSKGPTPVKPLEGDVVEKLGRTFFDVWYEGERMAVKADKWDFTEAARGPGCEFVPTHEARLTITEPGAMITIDLVKHTGTRQPSQGVVRQALAPTAPGDDKLRAAVAAQLARQGQGDLMSKDLGQANEAGQPCARVEGVSGEMCIWSGGRQWGFDPGPANDGDRMDAPIDSILLRSTPTNGTGHQWSTQRMTVGEAFDADVFAVPSGLSLSQVEE